MKKDKYTTIKVSSTAELTNLLINFDRGWIFRGQRNHLWDLQPSVERILSGTEAARRELSTACENYALKEFKARAHHYLHSDSPPEGKLGWLSLMQHHGVPTRLLDFTTSPFVALFFSMDGVASTASTRAAIWAVNSRELMKASVNYLTDRDSTFKYTYVDVTMDQDSVFEKYIDGKSHDICWITEPGRTNLRLEKQGGTFLFSANPDRLIESILFDSKLYGNEIVNKIEFPTSLAKDIYLLLKKMGIDNSRIYPGVDGLAKDIKAEMAFQIPLNPTQTPKAPPKSSKFSPNRQS